MKIICIGRNYLDHAKELNNKLSKEPLFFLKPDTAIQPKGHPFFIPDFSNNIHYEVELVIKISMVSNSSRDALIIRLQSFSSDTSPANAKILPFPKSDRVCAAYSKLLIFLPEIIT